MARGSSLLFSILLVTSLIGIAWTSLSGIIHSTAAKPIWIFIAGILPLFIYHISLLKKKGFLSQDKIDSVYYFGFLVTLASLGSSAFILSTQGINAISAVGAQFALGLLVTGYGLWARITLQSKLSTEENSMASLDDYIDKVAILNEGFYKTIDLFNRLSKEAAKDVREAGQEIISNLSSDIQAPTAEISASLKLFSKSIKNIDLESLGEASKSIQDFSISMKSASIETPKLTESISLLSDGIIQTNQNHVDLSKSIQIEVENISRLCDALVSFSASSNGARDSMIQFNNTMGELSNVDVLDVNNITSSLKQFYLVVEQSTNSIELLKAGISQNQNGVLSVFEDTKNTLGNQARELNTASQELGVAMSALANSLNKAATQLSR